MLSSAFSDTGRAIAQRLGLSLAIAEMDHPVGESSAADVEAKADRVVDAVVHGLLVGVDATESKIVDFSSLSEPVIDLPSSVEEQLEWFEGVGWWDGLPLVAPIPARVERALSHSGLDGDEELPPLPPLLSTFTARHVAANAVMAGCRPEYLPIVLAAIDAVTDPAYGLSHRQISTHAGAPLIIVNGPICHEIGLNSGTGVFGPGWRANATIGRALRLVLINLGGALPGVIDMSQHAHPGKYSYCIAEAENVSPWEPLHVERGFKATDNVVTVVNAEAPHSATDNINTTAREILTTLASTLATLGSNNLYSQGEPVLVLGPEHAKYIADDGWSKRDVKFFLYEMARQPWALVKNRGKSRGPEFPKWLETAPKDDDMVPVVTEPDDLIVVVCGGAGGKSMVLPTAGKQSRSVTREIQTLPGTGG